MNFLDYYVLYSASNEAPMIFHRWAGISTLSHLIGPRVWTHMGGALTYYPNMYVNLVGKPGIMKSTAMRQAQRIVDHISKIQQCPASSSKEAITLLMGQKDSPCVRSYTKPNTTNEGVPYTQLSIFASEIVSLLNAAGNPNGTIEFLTDIWDRVGSSYKEQFKSAKSAGEILRPYITILACLTPETLKNLVTSKVVSTGASRRMLFVHADRNGDPIPFIEPSGEQETAWTHCLTHATVLQTVVGGFQWEESARAFYINWYTSFKSRIDEVESPVLKNFYMSKAEYVIKVSMLLQVGQIPPVLVHTLDSFTKALDYVTEIEKGACLLFDTSGRNELAEITQDVLHWLRLHPGEHREDKLIGMFYQHLQKPREEMRLILEQLNRTTKIKLRFELVDGTMMGLAKAITVDEPGKG